MHHHEQIAASLHATRKRTPRQHVRVPTADGRGEVVLVPLAGRGAAVSKIDAADFDRLRSLGFTSQWTANDNGQGNLYVRAYADLPGKLATVARVILDAAPGWTVHYRNGDSTDLRRSNLVLLRGYAKRAGGGALEAADEF